MARSFLASDKPIENPNRLPREIRRKKDRSPVATQPCASPYWELTFIVVVMTVSWASHFLKKAENSAQIGEATLLYFSRNCFLSLLIERERSFAHFSGFPF